MQAVIADHPGPPEVLHLVELPDPHPGPGQVLVAVEVAAITFVDTQMRAGTSLGPSLEFPATPGNGVGGRVVSLGEGVDPSWAGALVVTSTGGSGGYATMAIAAANDLHRVPNGLGLEPAVALLADGRTALALSRAARIRTGASVLVTAAAGGVGSLLVQLASQAGARVVALAGGARKLQLASELGAEVTLDYTDPEWEQALVAATPDGLDVVFDGVGGKVSDALALRLHGGSRYLPHGAASGAFPDIDDAAAVSGAEVIPLGQVAADPAELHRLVDEALDLAAAGELRPVIGQTYPLADAATAHRQIEERKSIGKTLLVTGG